MTADLFQFNLYYVLNNHTIGDIFTPSKTKTEGDIMFYTQSQNNSGGSFDFDEDDGLTHFVVIEADSLDEAEEKASRIGIYYDGCSDGRDCHCCGDRWYGFDDPTNEPEVYGDHPSKVKLLSRYMGEAKEICVHYKDGRKEWY